MIRRAVFLDRDGVLIEDVDLLCRPEQVRIYPKVPKALGMLQSAGLALVVVTNQPVVARGLATEEEVQRVNGCIQQSIRNCAGGEVERFYYCPHHPHADVARYRVVCECRKPRPGMLFQAARELELSLSGSYMVGDRLSDIQAGQLAGCTTLLLKTGMHTAPPIESPDTDQEVRPKAVLENLVEAAQWILEDLA